VAAVAGAAAVMAVAAATARGSLRIPSPYTRRRVDIFTLIIVVGLAVGFIAILLLGLFHPRSGADVLDWRPTRSPEAEAQNEIDDVAQMIAAQNRIRARGGKQPRTIEEVEAQVHEQEQRMRDYADKYWREQREARVGTVNAEGGLTVYAVATCSKCQRLDRILSERSVEYETIDLVETPLDGAELRALLDLLGVPARELVRSAGNRDGALAHDASDEEIVTALAADPTLIMRPIVVRGKQAIVARPTERALELL
jgi:arsenate reductase